MRQIVAPQKLFFYLIYIFYYIEIYNYFIYLTQLCGHYFKTDGIFLLLSAVAIQQQHQK
jgi:hypothetical protein